MVNTGVVLRKAKYEDAKEIAQLNESHLHLGRKGGFLITQINEDEFGKYIAENPNAVSIAEIPNQGIVGFLQLSESVGSEVIQQLHWNSQRFKEIFQDNKAIYIEKVAVKDDYKRQKVGTLLYELIFREHPEYLFYSFIVRKPFANRESFYFHKKLAFIESAIFRAKHFLGFNDYESVMLMRASDSSKMLFSNS